MARAGKFIAYYRVSTDKQGKSGLGLEAQRLAVMNYLNGGEWKIICRVYRGRDRQARGSSATGCRAEGGPAASCGDRGEQGGSADQVRCLPLEAAGGGR